MVKEKDSKNFLLEVAPYLNLGWQLVATILIMTFIGILIDRHFATKPLFTLIFAFLGCAVAIYDFIRSVLKSSKKK
ncbi:MAG: AtpZ/AtpI family protein [Candidatus Kapaibacteriota bacterium]